MKGKQHQTPFPKMGKWRATERLGLVHANLRGPISPASNGEKRYLLCFIDDFFKEDMDLFSCRKNQKHFIISNVSKQWWKR